MNRHPLFSKRSAWIASLITLFSILVSACAQGAAYQQTTAQPTAVGLPATGSTVQSADNSKFGKILVDSKGMTLYTFEIDTATESKCTDSACVNYWPPLTVAGQPNAGSDVTGALATITRPDGSMQATYQGHPLYTFKLDQKPGDATGDGINQFGGIWHVVTLSGAPSSTPAGGSNGIHY